MKPLSRPTDIAAIENVRSGQKFLIYSILLYVAYVPISVLDRVPALFIVSGLAGLVAFFLSIYGSVNLVSGLGYSISAGILIYFLMIIPLANLITLFILNGRATAFLRAEGLHVGFMGSDKIQA